MSLAFGDKWMADSPFKGCVRMHEDIDNSQNQLVDSVLVLPYTTAP